ncbi:MAG: AAA family ATPase [Coprococcus sp.]
MARNQGGKGSRRLYYVWDDAGIKIAIILPQKGCNGNRLQPLWEDKVVFLSKNRKMCRNRKNILIKGARQIGKTESIEHFAEEHYENIVRINFVLEQKYKTIVSDGYECDLQRVFAGIEL